MAWMIWSREGFEDAAKRRMQDLLSFAKSYLPLRTRALADASRRGSASERAELYAVFTALAFTIGIAVNFASVGGRAPDALPIANMHLWRLIISCLTLSPLLALYWFLGRKQFWLPIGIIAFQQIPATIILCIAATIMSGPEPAHTDFTKLQLGQGQGTAAYEVSCGLTEELAKIVRLGRDLLQTDDQSNAADDQLSRGLLSPEAWRGRKIELVNRENDILRAQWAEVQHGDRTIEEFQRTYPNYRLSELAAQYGTMILGFFSLWHLVRGLFIEPTNRASAVGATFGCVAALSLGVAIYLAVGQVSTYPDPKEFVLQFEGRSPTSVREYLQAAQSFREGEARREGRVRAAFEQNKMICPSLRNYGLW